MLVCKKKTKDSKQVSDSGICIFITEFNYWSQTQLLCAFADSVLLEKLQQMWGQVLAGLTNVRVFSAKNQIC